MQEIRNVLISRLGNAWISHFSGDANPSKLFEGVKFRLNILLGEGGSSFSLWSSQYLKWFAAARPYLFSSITYASAPVDAWHMNLFPKLGSDTALRIVSKVRRQHPLVRFMSTSAGDSIYVHRVITVFVKCFSFIPYFRNQSDGVKKSEDYKPYAFSPKSRAQIAAMALNSSTFFVFFTLFGDCFHCGKEFVSQFPLNLDQAEEMHHQAAEISKRLMQDLRRNAVRRRAVSERTGAVEYDEFWPSKSKPILDEIDHLLAAHYGFTEEELDFIINYDFKYRMGRDAQSNENEDTDAEANGP
jgi:hypothetical protein